MTCCGTLTPEQIATLQRRLAQAEEAYHSLQMGGAVASFTDQNGERVEYRAANRTQLISYISNLRAQLGLPPTCGVVGSPIGFCL